MKNALIPPMILFLIFASAQSALAADTNTTGGNLPAYVPLEPLPGEVISDKTDFSNFINSLFQVVIAVGAIIAVGSLVFSGIVYMVSGAVGTKSQALKRIQASMWGLLLLIGAWLLLFTINPRLVGQNKSGTLTTTTTTLDTSTKNDTTISSSSTGSDCSKWGGGTLLVGSSNKSDLQTYTDKCTEKKGSVRSISTDSTGTSYSCDSTSGKLITDISCP